MTTKIILAGFGGQGILYASKTIAKLAMHDGKYVSWLPSYGPEMRGGTCNCGVIVSDEPIGSPIVTTPDIAIVFNIQSMDKFEPTLISGGTLIGQKTTTSPYGRNPEIQGYPVRVCEMLSTLEGCTYATRVSVDSPKNVLAAKKAIKKAFTNQIEKKGFSIVEVLSTCPSNWGLSPTDSLKWLRENMMPFYPLGTYKDKTANEEETK